MSDSLEQMLKTAVKDLRDKYKEPQTYKHFVHPRYFNEDGTVDCSCGAEHIETVTL